MKKKKKKEKGSLKKSFVFTIKKKNTPQKTLLKTTFE